MHGWLLWGLILPVLLVIAGVITLQRRKDRRQPGLETAPQRERHASTLRRKARAAYFAPMSVSAAGKAHCPETPASESVRAESVSAGTVESGARRIQFPCVSRPCEATQSASNASSR